MTFKGGLPSILAALTLAVFAVLPAAEGESQEDGKHPDELPLGRPGLEETRNTRQVAPGVTYTRVVRGEESTEDFYTVDVAFKAVSSVSGPLGARLRPQGYESKVAEVSERAPDAPQGGR